MKASNNEMILFYNFDSSEGMKKWKGICLRMGIRMKEVPPEDFGRPIGHVAGLPGYGDISQPDNLPTFSEPMMVLKNFTSGRIDELLRQSKKVGATKIPLKAVLTFFNAPWPGIQLYEELKKEHQAMQEGKSVHSEA